MIPGWKLPKVSGWPIRVVLINLIQLGVVLVAGFTWEIWFSKWSVFQLSKSASPIAGGLIAYFIATFIFYWWHRWRHEYDVLWVGFHQIHHSPQRLEVITSFYKHPGEMILNSVIGSLLVYTILGLSLEAGGIYTFCTAIGEFFYHTNARLHIGLDFSFNGLRCIVYITSMAAIKITTVTSHGGTCYLGHMRILKSGFTHVALMMPKSSN